MPPKLPFEKSPLTLHQQIDRLRSRGMQIDDTECAEHHLVHLNYYRLAAYWIPHANRSKQFVPRVRFKRILDEYLFDQELRRLVLEAVEYVEVSLRSQISYQLTQRYGSHPYQASEAFKTQYRFDKLWSVYAGSEEDYARHFKAKHPQSLPPLWAMVELMSFGQLSIMFAYIQRRADKNAIARTYGIDAVILQSYLHQLTTIRNIAAHHGRLWNRRMIFSAKKPKHNPIFAASVCADPRNKKIYNSLVFLKYMLDIIALDHQLDIRFRRLVAQYGIDTRLLGFPQDWEERPVWSVEQQSKDSR